MSQKRVLVIGCGPAGISQMCAFAQSDRIAWRSDLLAGAPKAEAKLPPTLVLLHPGDVEHQLRNAGHAISNQRRELLHQFGVFHQRPLHW